METRDKNSSERVVQFPEQQTHSSPHLTNRTLHVSGITAATQVRTFPGSRRFTGRLFRSPQVDIRASTMLEIQSQSSSAITGQPQVFARWDEAEPPGGVQMQVIAICLLVKLQTTKTYSQLSRTSPRRDLFGLLSISRIMPMLHVFHIWICRQVSASGEAELHLYIPENLDFAFLISHQSPSHSLFLSSRFFHFRAIHYPSTCNFHLLCWLQAWRY